MPPRLYLQPAHMCIQCRHASSARITTTTPAPSLDALRAAPLLIRHPANQPPSFKPPEFRKSQLHRQYQSLLRSSPLMLVFQHSNLKSTEWVGIRRELATALRKVDEELAKTGKAVVNVGGDTKLQVVQTGIFASALKIVEFWDPNFEQEAQPTRQKADATPAAGSKPPTKKRQQQQQQQTFTHGLSKKAYQVANKNPHLQKHGLEPLLSGPLAVLTIPSVSPAHLSAAISILAPSAPDFPAPKRKTTPSYHEPAVQAGLQKMMLLGARIEGKVFDMEGVKWVGGIESGLDGLRARLVAILQGAAAGITNSLEAASKSLYLTVEGRRMMLEEEEKRGSSEGKTDES